MGYENNIKTNKSFGLKTVFAVITSLAITAMITLLGIGINTTHAATVKQVSTGAETACAVTDGNAKCWGSNQFGQLGNNTTTNSSTPVVVIKDAGVMAGKFVEKVSVGKTHACALADAQVYCWGDNSHGQLGNNSTTNSSKPVVASLNQTFKAAQPSVCTLWFLVCWSYSTAIPEQPVSALINKEIIDVSAGEHFTCALASDGTVACWGEGDNGRLGTNSTTDSLSPKAIYSAAGSAFAGKKGVKLAKAAGTTMCVIAVEGTATTATGSPYCWGYGIDDGRSIPTNGTNTVPCSKNTPTSKPATSVVTYTNIFESNKPVNVPGATFASVDGADYITGLSTNGRAYYWGMYGFIETATISNITTCVVNPCTSRAGTIVTLAGLSPSQKKAKASNTGGGDKKKNLNSNNTALNKAAHTAGTAAGGNTAYGGTSYGAYSTAGGSYYGIAQPGVSYSSANVGNNNNNNSCGNQTHYGYTKSAVYTLTGQKVATTPPAWSSTQSGLGTVSGNVFSGLFCATAGTATNCDTHGTSADEGQTGSNYTKQCTTTGLIFTTTTCTPAPTGPQQVVSNGWLAGKSITSLNTGASGYTCAIANGAVGCWGINTKGQLGNGSTTNKNVPTAVGL